MQQKARGETVTKETLRAFLDNYINPPKNNTGTLKGFMQEFIDNAENRINKKTGSIVGMKTQLGYKRTLKYLTAFEEKTKQTWELVSSHTARRSFATNLFLSGFPTLSIMQITGHKTEKAFMRYIKVTPEQHAKLLRLHWIEKGSHLKVSK
jgi:site-specific recombinase XerD